VRDRFGLREGALGNYMMVTIVLTIALGLLGLHQFGALLKRGENAVDASVRQREHEERREAEALAGGLPGQLSIAREESAAEGDLSIAEQPGAVSLVRKEPPRKS